VVEVEDTPEKDDPGDRGAPMVKITSIDIEEK